MNEAFCMTALSHGKRKSRSSVTECNFIHTKLNILSYLCNQLSSVQLENRTKKDCEQCVPVSYLREVQEKMFGGADCWSLSTDLTLRLLESNFNINI